MSGMYKTPAHADVNTFSLYLDQGKPGLYISLRPDDPAPLHRMFVTLCQAHGLSPLVTGEPGQVGVDVADPGWEVVFTYDGDTAPLMTIEWPASPTPLIYDVRKDSPSTWATDAILAGAVALIIGPALDWERFTVQLDGETIMMIEKFLGALADRQVAAGVVPVKVR